MSEEFDVLCPIGETSARRQALASRLQDLNGKTICQISNGMFRAETVLSAVDCLVKERYPTARVIPWTEFPQIRASGDIEARLEELAKLLQQRGAAAVISSTGG